MTTSTSSKPIVVTTIEEWRSIKSSPQYIGKSVAVVPTMGALHAGHLSLCIAAKASYDIVLVTIFVNPTQFNEAKDFETYPRTLDADIALMEKDAPGCVDFVFAPTVDVMYPSGSRVFTVNHNGDVSLELEGKARPGHFTGMLTVVTKLLIIADAEAAFFGEKDWQQLALVRELVTKALLLKTKIIGVPTVREIDGLAMSSRNTRLTPEERKRAPQLYYYMKHCATAEEARHALEKNGFEVEYIADMWGRRLGAVKLGCTRLIDNISLDSIERKHTV